MNMGTVASIIKTKLLESAPLLEVMEAGIDALAPGGLKQKRIEMLAAFAELKRDFPSPTDRDVLDMLIRTYEECFARVKSLTP